MQVILSDNHVLVVDKPAGMATQPDLQEEAKNWVKKEFSKPGNVFLHPIHRLDKPVSGLVLFARTSKALSRLNEAMRQRKIRKTYLAKVEGKLAEKKGTLRHFLLHGDHRAIIDEKGKEAILTYEVLKEFDNESLLEIDLETGRYHQIRAQFSAIGHPVVGDKKYGSKTKRERIALHHFKLQFPHPTKDDVITCESRVIPFIKNNV